MLNIFSSAVDKISDKLTSSNSPLMNQNQNLPESYQKEYISNVVSSSFIFLREKSKVTVYFLITTNMTVIPLSQLLHKLVEV